MPAINGPQKLTVNADGRRITIYTAAKVKLAFDEICETCMNLHLGAGFAQVIEAFYEQGMKDGRREMIEKMEKLKAGVKYLPPRKAQKENKTKTASPTRI